MSIEAELRGIAEKLDAHEKRHDREYQDLCTKQKGCSEKFEKLFEAVGDGEAADKEHKTRLNGLTNYEGKQDDRIDALGNKMDRWFIGIIVLAAVGYLANHIFF